MNRMLAIVERELRKFFHSPTLMMASMIFPLVQLIVLGNAFGGKIHDARVAIVDQDHGTQSLKIHEAFDAIQANVKTIKPVYYTNDKQAMEDVRNGRLDGALVIPPQFSERVYQQNRPRLALIVDNSDTELVFGLNLAGAIKAILTGIVITVLGSMIAGVHAIFEPDKIVGLLLMIVLTSVAFNTMMFLLMVRVEDPLVPRAIFGILNTLLFFPSGSIYPINAFPGWLRAIARVDPFTYSVHGFKAMLLKDAGLSALSLDLVVLSLFGAATLAIATPLFKRTIQRFRRFLGFRRPTPPHL